MSAIKIQNLEKTFGIRTIFKNVSFELKRGERLALIGANGAGKTTLIKCLIGEEDYTDGAVIIPYGETIGYLKQDVTSTWLGPTCMIRKRACEKRKKPCR